MNNPIHTTGPNEARMPPIVTEIRKQDGGLWDGMFVAHVWVHGGRMVGHLTGGNCQTEPEAQADLDAFIAAISDTTLVYGLRGIVEKWRVRKNIEWTHKQWAAHDAYSYCAAQLEALLPVAPQPDKVNLEGGPK